VNIGLYKYLKKREPLAIALSGGIDSSALILFCHSKQIRYAGFTVTGPHITDFEIQRVIALREEYSLNHVFFYYDFKYNKKIIINSKDRCFYCKADLLFGPANFFSSTHTLVDGTNYTDSEGFRPGMRSLKNLGIISPFAQLQINKGEIIHLAGQLGLSRGISDSRSCILARFNYGVYLDEKLVLRIRKAEDYLLHKGLTGFRLRVLGCKEYLLQIDVEQEIMFRQIHSGFDRLARQLNLYPCDVQFRPFAKITGYYDLNFHQR
jgi:pyridinium-3,5-biscarboxylic acid mononucleotide sulfurtransferase